MKILSKNTIISHSTKFRELVWVFYVLFLTTAVFLENSKFNVERQTTNSYGFKANQDQSHSKFVKDSKLVRQVGLLFDLESVEESEPTDETTEEEIIENDFLSYLSIVSNHSISKSSFANFSLSLQKRISIPFFLLHHSWRLPSFK